MLPRFRSLDRTGRAFSLSQLGVAALMMAASAAASSAGAQQQPAAVPAAAFEQGLFELRVGRAAAQTTIALVDSAGKVLLPVDAVLDLLKMPQEPTGSDSARRIPSIGVDGVVSGTATLDLRDRTLRTPASVEPLSRDAAVMVDGLLYLGIDEFKKFLRAEVRLDFEGLTVTFSRVPPFPVEQQALAEARRERRSELSIGQGVAAGRQATYRNRTGGTILDWNISTSPDQIARSTSVQGLLGLAIYGGSLTLGGTYYKLGPQADNVATTWNYSYNTPNSSVLRQVQVGDLLAGGAQLRSLRGISVTNGRLLRDGIFSEVELRPEVPSGWSYEVYQDGQLLGFAEAGHREAIAIPLRYGTTPVQVRMLGPAGEEVVSDYRYQVLSTFLRPGTVEYSAGVGTCHEQGCGRTTFGRVDVGVATRLTAGASVDWTQTDSSSHVEPAVRLLAIPRRDVSATFEFVPSGRSQLQLAYDNYVGVHASSTFGTINPGGAAVTSVASARERWFGTLRGGRAVREARWLRAIRTDLHVEGFREGGIDRLFGTLTLDAHRGSYGLRYERDPSLPDGLLQLSHFAVLRTGSRQRFSYIPVSGSIGATSSGIERLEGSITVRSGSRGSINLVGRWSEGSGTALSVNYDALLGSARVSARGISSSTGRASLITSGGGSIGYSPATGPLLLDQSGSNSAGVAGRVFYDNDGNGVFGAGDEPAPGLGVLTGSRRVTTDEEGRYRSWSILPYEVTRVAIDTLKDIRPDYIPLRDEIPMRATPNMFNTADFALVRTREVTGRLEAGEGISVVGGVTVLLIAAEGADTVTAVTFADGEFYISRIRPGRYELRVAASSLAALRAATPETVIVDVASTGPDMLIEIPRVVLRRATAAGAEAPPAGASPPR